MSSMSSPLYPLVIKRGNFEPPPLIDGFPIGNIHFKATIYRGFSHDFPMKPWHEAASRRLKQVADYAPQCFPGGNRSCP